MYVSGMANATSDGADAHLVDARALLALLQRGAVALRQELDDLGTDVVARARVLVAGIAQADHQEVGGGAPTPEHRLLVAGVVRGLGVGCLGAALAGLALFAFDRFALLVLGGDAAAPRPARRRSRARPAVATPSGSGMSSTRSWSPMRERRRRRSRSTPGCCPACASTVRWKSSCSSRPPSFTPSASPIRWIGTSALTATSRSDAHEVDVHAARPSWGGAGSGGRA